MPHFVNINGSWRNGSALSTNVNGAWRSASQGFVNINGQWRSWGGPNVNDVVKVELMIRPTSAFTFSNPNTLAFNSGNRTAKWYVVLVLSNGERWIPYKKNYPGFWEGCPMGNAYMTSKIDLTTDFIVELSAVGFSFEIPDLISIHGEASISAQCWNTHAPQATSPISSSFAFVTSTFEPNHISFDQDGIVTSYIYGDAATGITVSSCRISKGTQEKYVPIEFTAINY